MQWVMASLENPPSTGPRSGPNTRAPYAVGMWTRFKKRKQEAESKSLPGGKRARLKWVPLDASYASLRPIVETCTRLPAVVVDLILFQAGYTCPVVGPSDSLTVTVLDILPGPGICLDMTLEQWVRGFWDLLDSYTIVDSVLQQCGETTFELIDEERSVCCVHHLRLLCVHAHCVGQSPCQSEHPAHCVGQSPCQSEHPAHCVGQSRPFGVGGVPPPLVTHYVKQTLPLDVSSNRVKLSSATYPASSLFLHVEYEMGVQTPHAMGWRLPYSAGVGEERVSVVGLFRGEWWNGQLRLETRTRKPFVSESSTFMASLQRQLRSPERSIWTVDLLVKHGNDSETVLMRLGAPTA